MRFENSRDFVATAWRAPGYIESHPMRAVTYGFESAASSQSEAEVERELSSPDDAPSVQRRLAVLSSLNLLRPDHHVILVLRYWEDLSYDEICSVLEVSMPTVKMRLSRARAEFRRHYGDEP